MTEHILSYFPMNLNSRLIVFHNCETCSLVSYGKDCMNNPVEAGGNTEGDEPSIKQALEDISCALSDRVKEIRAVQITLFDLFDRAAAVKGFQVQEIESAGCTLLGLIADNLELMELKIDEVCSWHLTSA